MGRMCCGGRLGRSRSGSIFLDREQCQVPSAPKLLCIRFAPPTPSYWQHRHHRRIHFLGSRAVPSSERARVVVHRPINTNRWQHRTHHRCQSAWLSARVLWWSKEMSKHSSCEVTGCSCAHACAWVVVVRGCSAVRGLGGALVAARVVIGGV